MFEYPCYGVPVLDASVEAVEAAVHARDSHYLSEWEIDPLGEVVSRTARADRFAQYAATAPPQERTLSRDYMALRLITRDLISTELGL